MCAWLAGAMALLWRGVPQGGDGRQPAASRTAPPSDGRAGTSAGPRTASEPVPTVVTLNISGVPGDEALAELAKQSGYAVEPIAASMRAAMRKKPVTLATAAKPFWPVLLELCGALGVYPYSSSENRSTIYLSASAADRLKCPRVEAGACVVTLNSITTTASVDPSGLRPPHHEVTLSMSLLVEPKLKVLSFPAYAIIEEAADDRGQSMMPDDTAGPGSGGPGGPWSAQVSARLKCPPSPGTRIAKVKGRLDMMLYERMENWEIENPLKARRRTGTVGGVEVEFRGLERTLLSYSADFVVGAAQQDQAAAALFSPLRTVKLLNATGQEFAPAKVTIPEGRMRAASIHATFPRTAALGEPHRLVLSVPADVKVYSVPFEFVNLPLP